MITLITEPEDYSSQAIAVYKSLGDVFLLPELGKRKNEILKRTNILVLRLRYKIDSSWFDKMPNLKIIATNTTGLNHVDIAEAQKRGVKVISLRGRTSFLKNITATAELTLGLILALVRKIPWSFEHVKKGGWNRDLFKGHQLQGKTLGIVGYGRLGKIMARYARALGMKVIFYDPYKKGPGKVSLEKLCRISDIISIHALLTPETENLIGARHFRLMKPGAILINTARGEIVEEKALGQALQKKRIAGAALDVMREESQDGRHLKKSELWKLSQKNDNILIGPHTGGAAYEAMAITEEFIARLVKKYAQRPK